MSRWPLYVPGSWNFFPHVSQENGCSPVWSRRCIVNLYALAHTLLHISQGKPFCFLAVPPLDFCFFGVPSFISCFMVVPSLTFRFLDVPSLAFCLLDVPSWNFRFLDVPSLTVCFLGFLALVFGFESFFIESLVS